MKKSTSIVRGISLWVFALTLGAVTAAQSPRQVGAAYALVNWTDLATLTDEWLSDGHSANGRYDSADLDFNHKVDLADFALLANSWLKVKTYSVVYDPYADVDWDTWYRAMAQHHDHMGRLSLDRIKAYDEAGYNVVAAMDYAGRISRGDVYCGYRLWPVHEYLRGFDSDQQVLSTLQNIKLFVPAMEEIGLLHMTSPFLTTYIERWEPDYCQTRQPWHYDTSQQCIDLINQYGGMAILAHPTRDPETYMELDRFRGIEIVSAFYYEKWSTEGGYPNAANYIAHFRTLWDQLLTQKDTTIWGFAVNDWFGPWKWGDDPWIDSGKIVVMIPAYDINEYKASLEQGCFFAIFDWAQGRQNKNQYPAIVRIAVGDHTISIDTPGRVDWIANGEKVAEGNGVDLSELSPAADYKYIRAEIWNDYGMVYTQPWTIALLPK